MNKILIIEDDLIDQMAFTRMLDQQGTQYEYSIANSIKEAVSELSESKFDLVISDLNLADGTTFDLLEHLKNIPFILISGNENEDTINSLIRNSGAIAFFTKDINLNYLKKLGELITKIFNDDFSNSIVEEKSAPKHSDSKILQSNNVIVNLENNYKIFDEKKEDIQESLELFIQYKPNEMDELHNYINNKDCKNVIKITHRMKSGYRFLGMKEQANLAEFIQENVESLDGDCQCHTIHDAFKKLSLDTKIAIELLKKEIPFL